MSDQGKRQRRPAFGYTRTSTATNLGEDKDSVPRQKRAIQAYANRTGYIIAEWFDDGDVKGADPIETRKGFAAMIEAIAGDGCCTIIVETASRFARDLMVQEAGFHRLKSEGITLIAADSPDSFTDDSPTSVLIRQILGAVAQFDKAMTVAKLRGARDKKRRKYGKCEGRKTYAERDAKDRTDLVAQAKRLGEQRPRLSLREIAAELAKAGKTTKRGLPYSASAVKSMLLG